MKWQAVKEKGEKERLLEDKNECRRLEDLEASGELIERAEDALEANGQRDKGFRKGACYRRLCGLCKQNGHSRIECQQLSLEQRAEYADRSASLVRLADALQEAQPVPEPLTPASSVQSANAE